MDPTMFQYQVIGGGVGGLLILIIICLLIAVIYLLCKMNRKSQQQSLNENHRKTGSAIPTQGFDNPTYGEQEARAQNHSESIRGSSNHTQGYNCGEEEAQMATQNINLQDSGMYATVNDREQPSQQPSEAALAHSYAYVRHDSSCRRKARGTKAVLSSDYAEVSELPYNPTTSPQTPPNEVLLAVRRRISQPPGLEDENHYSHLRQKVPNRYSMPLLSATGDEYSKLNFHTSRDRDRHSQFYIAEPAASSSSTQQTMHIYGVLEGPTPVTEEELQPQGIKELYDDEAFRMVYLDELSEALYDDISSVPKHDPVLCPNVNTQEIYDDIKQ